MKMINLTPTWLGLLPGIIAVLEDGTDAGKKICREELRKMAKAADDWNRHCDQQAKPKGRGKGDS